MKEWIDEEYNRPVVNNAYVGEAVFTGRYSRECPDIYVGFNIGYRASWQTALGAVPADLMEDNQKKLNLSDRQKERWHKKCLCLVEFEHVREIPPLAFDHQGNMDDWLIIEKIEDVVVGTSIKFDYEKSKFK